MFWKLFILFFLNYGFPCAEAGLSDTEYDRMPSLFALDHYDRCLRQGGTYCLVNLNLHADEDNDLMKLIQEHSSQTTKHYNYTYLQRGVCVTKTCAKYIDKDMVGKQNISYGLEKCMNESIWEEHGIEAKLAHILYCDERDSSASTDVFDWVVAAAFVALLAANLVGTCYDVIFRNTGHEKNSRSANPVLMSFSVVKNTENLIKPRDEVDAKTERLQAFHGIRAITSFWVISAHVLIIFASGFTDNPRDYERGFENGTYQFLVNGFMIVQIFFVMSGFLLAYNFQVQSESTQITWKHLPKIFANRWLRLTPAYALVVAFSATWLRHMGSGPLWNLFVSGGAVADCRSYWWLHLLYLQNYVPEDRFCTLQAWHLAADTQVFIVGAVVHIATRARGRRAALAALLLLGMAMPALHVWLQDLDAIVLIGPEVSRTFSVDTYFKMHIRGHNNLAGFTIGMVTGYLVYHWQKNKVDISKYKVFRNLCWAIIPSIITLFLTGTIFYPEEGRALLGLRLVYAATHRLVISGIAAFGIISMVMRCEDKFRALFEWRGWQIPGKLSYSVFLLHMIFIHIIMGTTSQLRHVSFFYMMIIHFGVVTMTYLAALPYHVLVEAPLYRLVKTYFEKNQQVAKKYT